MFQEGLQQGLPLALSACVVLSQAFRLLVRKRRPAPCATKKSTCRTWFVKGAWSRKLRTNPGAPSEEDQHHWERLSRAKSWERASHHLICSQCRRWAYDLGNRGQVRASRQHPQSFLEESPWESLQAILEKEPSMQLLPKSAPLLAWIEQHESDFAEGSLAHWLAFRIATCLEEDIEDAHGIHCAAAQLRKLQAPQQKQSFSFISATLPPIAGRSRLGSRTRSLQPLVSKNCTFWTINVNSPKSTMIGASGLPRTLPAFNTGKGTSGGIMLGARTHINMREGPQFALEGKGFQFGIFRFHGHDLAVGTVYLESGAGLDGGVNPRVMAELLVVIQSFACKWLIAGDWNMTWDELQESSFPRLAQAGVAQPSQATTTHGRTLDYALCSRTIAGLVTATVLWDVPFRPHAAVLFEFDVGGLDMPVLRGAQL